MAPQSLGARFRSRFRRRTSSGRFIAEIDGLRFPAIAVVVFAHLWAYFSGRPHAPALTSWGEIDSADRCQIAGEGVVLFFIISGFVLALPFASASLAGTPPVKLGDYYLRRLTRLEPPYLISLVGLLLLKIVARRFHLVAGQETDAVLLRHFAVSAAYLHNVVYGVPSIINGVAWSLEIEIQFYLLVPLLTQVFRLRSTFARRATILVAIVGAIAIQQAWIVDEGRLYLSILNFAQYFLFGFLLADLYLTERIGTAEKHWAWDVASALSWIAVFGFWPAQVLSPVVVPFVAFVAFVSVFRGPLTNAVFTNAWIYDDRRNVLHDLSPTRCANSDVRKSVARESAEHGCRVARSSRPGTVAPGSRTGRLDDLFLRHRIAMHGQVVATAPVHRSKGTTAAHDRCLKQCDDFRLIPVNVPTIPAAGPSSTASGKGSLGFSGLLG